MLPAPAGAASKQTAPGIDRPGHDSQRQAAGSATPPAATARVAVWALLALIVFSIVLIFVHISRGALIYSVLGLAIFAAFTMFGT